MAFFADCAMHLPENRFGRGDYIVAKTEVRYVDGFDRLSNPPAYARTAGLGRRFAVVQDTYRPDIGEMYFDVALWLSLLDFAMTLTGEVRIGLTEGLGPEVEVAAFLDSWSKTQDEDREPTGIRVRDDGRLVLAIEPVFWCSVGGPQPYSDSYTYEICSAAAVGAAVMAHLVAANTDGWNLADAPIIAFGTQAEVPKLSLRQKLREWLT